MAGHCCAAEKPACHAGRSRVRAFSPLRAASDLQSRVHQFNSGRGRTAISGRRSQQMASCARNVAERCASARTGNRGSPARRKRRRGAPSRPSCWGAPSSSAGLVIQPALAPAYPDRVTTPHPDRYPFQSAATSATALSGQPLAGLRLLIAAATAIAGRAGLRSGPLPSSGRRRPAPRKRHRAR
jgi:hypothetical protein